jgi:predicted MFS family arabinose efflux permease
MPAPSRSAHPDAPAPLATIIWLSAVGAITFNIQPLYLGALADNLGLGASQLGFVAGIEILGAALAGIAASFWVRRAPWRLVAAVALGVMAVGNLVSVSIADYGTLLALRFVTGLCGSGTVYALSFAALGATRRPDRNFALALFAQVGLGIAGYLVLPPLLPDAGMATIYLPLAGTAALALPLLGALPPGPGGMARATAAPDPDPGPDPATAARAAPAAIWLALCCQFVWFLGLGGLWAFLERIGDGAGLGPEAVGGAIASGMAVGLLGAFAAALLADRFGRTGPFTAALTLQLLAMLLLGDVGGLTAFVVAVALYNGTWNFALPYLFSLAAAVDRLGTRVVLLATAQTVGLTFGASLAGLLVEWRGLGAAVAQGLAAPVLALGLFVVAARLSGAGSARAP